MVDQPPITKEIPKITRKPFDKVAFLKAAEKVRKIMEKESHTQNNDAKPLRY